MSDLSDPVSLSASDAASQVRATKTKGFGRLTRFALVGGFNTALDFALLFAFVYALGINPLMANIVSTGVCLFISFLLNQRWTFKSGNRSRTQFVSFMVVTLTGLWLLQPLLIWLTTKVLQESLAGPLTLLIAKTMATVASMTWNYILYAKLVFRH